MNRARAWLARLWGGSPSIDSGGAKPAPVSARLRAELARERTRRVLSAEAPEVQGTRPQSQPLARFRMTVDEGGDWRVLLGGCTSLGHAGGEGAEVGIHGDLAPLHGELAVAESFHGGQGWLLRLMPGQTAHAEGQPVDSTVALTQGLQLCLGESTHFDVRRNDPASASVRLEPQDPAEVAGAGGLLLWYPGPGGIVRIGGDVDALIGISGTVHPVLCEGQEDSLLLVCEGGFLRAGDDSRQYVVSLPIEEPIEILARTRPGEAPVAICFLPW